jgi:Mg-chelatase subunit ChlD
MTTAIPQEWMCSITLQVMRDPVIGPDGHTYERSAISEWLAYNDTSPVTRQRMQGTNLIPNIALRNLIQASAPAASQTASAAAFKDLKIVTTAQQYTHNGVQYIHVHNELAEPAQRQPIVLLAIIDTSGSMNEGASLSEGTEEYGFTRLDLVKHGVRTLSALLGPEDMLGLITFSNNAQVVLPPTAQNDAGRASVLAALERVHADASTNIWDGIRLAATLAADPRFNGRHIVGMLLTDGYPNINPPRGIVPTLRTLSIPNPWTLHAYGFGYNIDSHLLSEIAGWGGGQFGFIPDCTMVGTVFINALANILSTARRASTLNIGARSFTIGSLSDKQDFVCPVEERFESVTMNGESVAVQQLIAPPAFAHAHYEYKQAIKAAIASASQQNISLAETHLKDWHTAFKNSSDTAVQALCRDIESPTESEGQIGMSPRFFNKWGQHYMRAYVCAQDAQQSMNFKDPGLQIYGNDLFKTIQTDGDTTFCTLPAPKPTRQQTTRGVPMAALASMSVFHNASGGCVEGKSQVLMADDRRKAIQECVAGERVWTPSGPTTIKAVVVCNSKAPSQPMVQLGNLCITPWHPVYVNHKWQFPTVIMPYASRLIQTVYNLVLDSGHIVDIEGVQCVTLGHGLKGAVVEHTFFGTEAVIDCLKKQPGWNVGRPTFKNLGTVRDHANNSKIIGWIDLP